MARGLTVSTSSWAGFSTCHGATGFGSMRQAVELVYGVFPPRDEYTWQGLSVFAFDGSKYTLPATQELRSAFDRDSGLDKPGKGHYPQVLVNTAYDVFRRLPVGRTVCPIKDGNEREQALLLLACLPSTGVCLFDRGYRR